MQNSDNEKLAQELISLEKRYWQAMQDHDLEAALSLTDFPCVVASEHGVKSVNREEFTKMFEAHGPDSVKDFFFGEEPEVRILNESTAIIGYKTHSTVTLEGESRTIDAVDTSTWIKRDGKWVCALHTETELAKAH